MADATYDSHEERRRQAGERRSRERDGERRARRGVSVRRKINPRTRQSGAAKD